MGVEPVPTAPLLSWVSFVTVFVTTLCVVACVYFAAVTFSTLGLGDLVPSGTIRFMVGTESLVGFVLISWSAAFTYLEMERFWRSPHQ